MEKNMASCGSVQLVKHILSYIVVVLLIIKCPRLRCLPQDQTMFRLVDTGHREWKGYECCFSARHCISTLSFMRARPSLETRESRPSAQASAAPCDATQLCLREFDQSVDGLS